MFYLLCDICCDSASIDSIEELTEDEWRWLWELSLRHKVSPVMVSKIKSFELSIPDFICPQISSFHRNNLLRSMQYSAELARITHILNNENIRFIGFKGVALLGVLNLALGDRHCGDLDVLLIDPADLPAADSALALAGYQRSLEIDDKTLAKPELLRRFNTKDLHYFHAGRGIDLELHMSLFHIDHLSVEENGDLFTRRSEINIGGTSVPVMCRDDYLLYLLLHGSISVWHRLKWLVDIPLVSQGGKDYMDNAFHIRCTTLGVQRVVLQGLYLANRFLKMPISETVKSNLESQDIKKMNTKGAIKFISSRYSPKDNERLKYLCYRLFICCFYWPSMRSELSFKLRCINTLFVSLKDYRLMPLPSYLHWLYLPLRPILWLCRPFRQ